MASKIHGEIDADGTLNPADMALRASPSVLFDAVVVLAGPEGDETLAADPNAVAFLMDAHRHCNAVAWNGVPTLANEAGIEEDLGLVNLEGKSGVKNFIDAARVGRFWDREADSIA